MKQKYVGLGIISLLLFIFVPASTGTHHETTVVGTGDPAIDVPAVQDAVDKFNTVYLQGEFDFGTNYVHVSKPDVTLTAQNLGDASITGVLWNQNLDGPPGRNNPYEGLITVMPDDFTNPTSIPTGFKMTNLKFYCQNLQRRSTAISLYNIEDPTNLTIIRNNAFLDISNNALGVHPAWVNGEIYIQHNEFSGAGGGSRSLFTFPMGTGTPDELLEISDNIFGGMGWAITIQVHHMVVDVHHNVVAGHEVLGATIGILSNNWLVQPQGNPPYPRDPDSEPPTTIRNNAISDCLIPIWLGSSGEASVNHLVTENTISGSCGFGIALYAYGLNNKIIDNDLSMGSFAWEQILIEGPGHTVANNTFGASSGSWPAVAIYATNDYHAYPDSVPHDTYGVVLMENDYRNTGLPGWEYGIGCIQIGLNWNPDGITPRKVRDCLIKEEGRFPEGSGGARKHIMNLVPPVGVSENNRIVGYPAYNVFDPGIGQRMKEAREELIEQLQALAEEIKK